ncbi:hypothetical protein LAZ67_12002796 [Cordylochernes scorpioides]|uniref:Mos1 transposase HTH domain-containing protein n=1 Tax=Cordylochernes scorpioides TaxID=51811 RepID=A0ABY6L221_9ARAC|nr:hypothetical protein LAZ67_12002796 [Cordylochernes scorpioides]
MFERSTNFFLDAHINTCSLDSRSRMGPGKNVHFIERFVRQTFTRVKPGRSRVHPLVYHNLDQLKSALVKAMKEIPIEKVRAAIDQWPERLRSCVKYKGVSSKMRKTASETFQMLKLAFGEAASSQSKTFKWFSRFKSG